MRIDKALMLKKLQQLKDEISFLPRMDELYGKSLARQLISRWEKEKKTSLDGIVSDVQFCSQSSDYQYYKKILVAVRGAMSLATRCEMTLPVCQRIAAMLEYGPWGSFNELVIPAITELNGLEMRLRAEKNLFEEDPDDPWVKVKVGDVMSRQKVFNHAKDEDKDWVRRYEKAEGYYEIKRSRLDEYLSPSMVRSYLGEHR